MSDEQKRAVAAAIGNLKQAERDARAGGRPLTADGFAASAAALRRAFYPPEPPPPRRQVFGVLHPMQKDRTAFDFLRQ